MENTQIFLMILVVYIVIMYYNIQKIKNNKIELDRFRDQVARFTYLQLAFGVYDYIQDKFEVINLLNKIMISHIGIASFTFIKESFNFIKI
jgi:hypothetical protein